MFNTSRLTGVWFAGRPTTPSFHPARRSALRAGFGVGSLRRCAAFLVAACCTHFAACKRAETPPPKAREHAAPATGHASDSPSQTVRRIHAERQAGRYESMLELFAPPHRRELLELVLSVDELIAAESGFQRAMQQTAGEGTATHFSRRAQVVNILGPLSRDVEIIGEQVTGDTAEVIIQVAGRVPLQTVRLERRSGAWLVVPDEPVPGLAEELRNLADVTRRVTGDLKRRRPPAAQSYRDLIFHQAPILERISKLMNRAAATQPAAPPP